MAPGADRQLVALVAGARIGCVLRVVLGGGLMAGGLVAVTSHMGGPEMFGLVFGLVPAAIGLYLMVRTWLRAAILGRILRRPGDIELAELAMRWGQPAVRVTFRDGAQASLSTGRVDRNLLIEAIRRRGLAQVVPGARVVRA